MRRFGLMLVLAVFYSYPASAGQVMCGDRGGPGYRDHNGHCLSWYQLAKGACCPLSACTPEHLHAGAEKITKLRCKL